MLNPILIESSGKEKSSKIGTSEQTRINKFSFIEWCQLLKIAPNYFFIKMVF